MFFRSRILSTTTCNLALKRSFFVRSSHHSNIPNTMEITKDNFIEVLPYFKASVEKCLFYAFDLEMTGVQLPGYNISYDDTFETRYSKLKRTAESYSPVQVGICTFEETSEPGSLIAKPFTFYIYPHPRGPEGSRVFNCQSNTLNFLYKNHFVFNKWIRSGVPFLRRSEMSTISSLKDNRKIEVNDSNITFFTDLRSTLSEFKCSEEETINIATKNSYERRIVYQETSEIFGSRLNVTSSQNEMNLEKKKTMPEVPENLIEPIVTEANFGHIIDVLLESKKVIVGHNCLLDLCFFYNHFIDKLPDTLNEFKSSITSCFPMVIDTKYVASFHSDFKNIRGSTTLESLLAKLNFSPYSSSNYKIAIETLNCAEESQPSEKFHDAGYDAYCTGKIILSIIAHIRINNNTPGITFNLLEGYQNQMFLMVSPFPHLDLSREVTVKTKPQTERYLISGLKQNLRMSEFNDIFGKLPFDIKHVNWIDSSRCWIDFSIPVCANESVSKDSQLGLFSAVPTGRFSDMWADGSLQKPLISDFEQNFKGANMISWKQWYDSTIPKKIEYSDHITSSSEESETESEAESEAGSEKSESEYKNKDEIDLLDDLNENIIEAPTNGRNASEEPPNKKACLSNPDEK